MNQKFIMLKSLVVFFFSTTLMGQANPNINWKKLESKHFDLIYDAKQKDLALEYLKSAEKAYDILNSYFSVKPEKTVVILNDQTDLANGLATPLPHPTIITNTVFPLSSSSIADYGHWPYELLLHEYTHILTMEPTSGFMDILRTLFGRIVVPNALLPRWYLEGNAVELESRLSQKGRLRSSYYNALVRSMVLDGVWGTETISRINESNIPSWPQGQRPYFYGALMWNYMIEKESTELLEKLNKNYSRRVPYLINSPVEDIFGADYSELLKKMSNHFQEKTQKDINNIQKDATADIQIKQTTGDYITSPRVSPDGKKLIFVEKIRRGEFQISILERDNLQESFSTQNSKVLIKKSHIGSVRWHPNSKEILISSIHEHKHIYRYSDLYIYNLSTKETKQLTEGLRAHDAIFNHDGSEILFVKYDSGRSFLQKIPYFTSESESQILNPNSKEVQTLLKSNLNIRYSNPILWTKNNVLFASRNIRGEEKLINYSLAQNKITRLKTSFKSRTAYQRSKNSLLFLSDDSGVSNLYVQSPRQKPVAITNTLTHVFEGTIDSFSNEVIFTNLTSKGVQLAFQKNTLRNQRLKNIEPLFAKPKTPPPTNINISYKEKDYSGWSYMWPQFWVPLLSVRDFSSLDRGVLIGAQTFSQDPVQHHSISLLSYYDTLSKKLSYAGSYTNRQLPVALQIFGAREFNYYFGLDLIEENTTLSLSGQFYIPGLSTNWNSSISWAYSDQKIPGTSVDFKRTGPSVSLAYDNTSKGADQISPQSGISFFSSYTHYLKQNDYLNYSQTRANLSAYFPSFLSDRHAIMLKTRNFISPSNRSFIAGTEQAGNPISTGSSSSTVVRGYPTGNFFGYDLSTLTAEYRFPLWSVYEGSGTIPLFLRRWSAALFYDAVTLDGFYISNTGSLNSTDMGTFFSGTGLELKSEWTLAYHVPMNVRLGFYYGLNERASGEFIFFMGLDGFNF